MIELEHFNSIFVLTKQKDMKTIINKIVNANSVNLNVQFFTLAENNEISKYAKAAGKNNLFFDFDGNELNISRRDFVNDVKDGKLNGVHIQMTDTLNAVNQVRMSKNNDLIRIA